MITLNIGNTILATQLFYGVFWKITKCTNVIKSDFLLNVHFYDSKGKIHIHRMINLDKIRFWTKMIPKKIKKRIKGDLCDHYFMKSFMENLRPHNVVGAWL